MGPDPPGDRMSTPSSLVERLDALYEYDREPVDESKLHGWRTFIAMFSSEHIAGTEFVLGTLLVMLPWTGYWDRLALALYQHVVGLFDTIPVLLAVQ